MKRTTLLTLLVFISWWAVMLPQQRALAYPNQDIVMQQITIGEAGNPPQISAVDLSGSLAIAGVGNSAYILEIEQNATGGRWIQKQKLSPNGISADNFGIKVAISGKVAMVTKKLADIPESRICTFERDDWGQWNETETLTGSYPLVLGENLALIKVEVWPSYPNGISCYGDLYEKNSAGGWSKLKRVNQCFAAAISGSTLIAFQGYLGYERPGLPKSWCRVNIFERLGAPMSWVENQNMFSTSQYSDSQVDILDNTAAYGVIEPACQGVVHIIERDAGGAWNKGQRVIAADGEVGDGFGKDVVLTENQVFVVQKNVSFSTTKKSAVYCFERSGVAGQWVEKQKLTSDAGDSNQGFFGAKVAVSGNLLIIAEQNDSLISGTDFIALHIYDKDSQSGNWIERRIIKVDNGTAVALSGRSMMVAAGAQLYFYNIIR